MAATSQLPNPPSDDAVVNPTLLSGGTKIIFDLGLRKDAENYIPPVAERIRTRRTTDIDGVIFAHLHYDHVRDPSRFSGPPTKFIIGPGTMEALLSGPNTYPTNKESIFDSNILPRSRTVELPFPSSPVLSSVSLLSSTEEQH
ncbi:hypothetical protein GX50_04402 [[Emmonsia] crescens]|uniref:Metallo-beta-lactamase domain-containing protein n=1 Tax=[Emmonsia] crescens TaxID=73230 RepID=A0A2B7ZHE6_9EURO|nr:hypothetical protein GX50_04402 [Emmonsia crescens]